MDAEAWRTRVAALYAGNDEGDIAAVLDESLDPLGPDVLFDVAAELGVDAGSTVVDIGARDGQHLLELQQRFGCAAVGIEPMSTNLANLARAGLPMTQAFVEALPLRSGIADLVWVRDVSVHVPDLDAAFAEIARIIKPGAAVLVFAVFATDLLEPSEAVELFTPLAIAPSSADRANFERAATGAGLMVDRHVRLDGQWREHGEEHDSGRTSRQLLRVARLRREPDRYRLLLGDFDYAAELADSLYGVYQLLGKLSASIYVLR